MADKVIKGTRDRKNYQIIRGSSDQREIRCINPKCRNVAKQSPDGKGGFICRCPVCGAQFKFSSM